MRKLICFILIFFYCATISYSGEKNVSFLTVVGPTLNSVKVQAHNTAYINGMKIIGSRTTKAGNNWVRTVKITSKY